MDVDKCVRLLEKAMSDKNISLISSNINKIQNKNRVTILRNKGKDEIENFIKTSKEQIRLSICNKYYNNSIDFRNIKLLQTSNDNKIDADLYHILPDGAQIDIELKFGNETNRNIGMKSFEQIFGTDIFTKTLSTNVRQKWVEKYIKNGKNKEFQFKKLRKTLNEAIVKFNGFQDVNNNIILDDRKKYLEKLIIGGLTDGRNIIKFSFKNTNDNDIKILPVNIGKWVVDEVSKITETNKRVNIFCRNFEADTSIKFVLNWKNNYKISKQEKVQAKLGFGTPSWNIWVV